MRCGAFISSVSPVACPSGTGFKEVAFQGLVSHSTGPQNVFVLLTLSAVLHGIE